MTEARWSGLCPRAVELRPAADTDREIAFEILRDSMRSSVEATWGAWDDAWQREHFRASFALEDHRILEDASGPVGLLCVLEYADYLFLSRLFLVPRVQNAGIGTQLLQQLLHSAHGRALPLVLTVLKVSPARRLYERLGFKILSETQTHFRMEARPTSTR